MNCAATICARSNLCVYVLTDKPGGDHHVKGLLTPYSKRLCALFSFNHLMTEKMLKMTRPKVAGKEGVLFIRNDNVASIKAHMSMGMKVVAEFEFSGNSYSVFSFIG